MRLRLSCSRAAIALASPPGRTNGAGHGSGDFWLTDVLGSCQSRSAAMTVDSEFAGSIPAIYEECLVPVLFAPYAVDLVRRAVALGPREVLELAAGTGAVSHALAETLPRARIVATDLNPAMLEVAAARG